MTPEAIAAADDLALPVLETAYAVPFVTVARTVADSNSQDASGKLVQILRVYDVLRRSSQAGASTETLLEQLGRACAANLHVVDVARGADLLPRREQLRPTTRQALGRAAGGASRVPSRRSCVSNGGRRDGSRACPSERPIGRSCSLSRFPGHGWTSSCSST